MNNMYGIKGIEVKVYNVQDNRGFNILNDFLKEHDGNIIDIQFQNDKTCFRIMVVYKAT